MNALALLLMQEEELVAGALGAIGLLFVLFYIAVIVLMIACLWIVFTKAGHPGWAAIVPIYNIIILLQIARKPLWWIILMIIPLVNIVIVILVYVDIAKAFGKGAGFAVGMLLLPFIFFPILAFGSAQYR